MNQETNNMNNFQSNLNNTNDFGTNPNPVTNNISDEHSSNSFSKGCKIIIISTLIGAIIIFFDIFITSMDWYGNLLVSTIFTHDEQLKQALEILRNLIDVFNWVVVLIITIVSIILLIKDKKQKKNTSIYEWYIIAGILHIFIGTVGITSIIYSVSTLLIVTKNKNAFINEKGKDCHKFYMIFSLIVSLLILIGFMGIVTGNF